MALLRLTLLALAACGQAGAQPPPVAAVSSGIKAPAGWDTLADVATAVASAAQAPGVTVDGVEAWGDRARGCYATWLVMRGAGATATNVVAGLADEQLATHDVVVPETADGVVTLAFDKGAYKGRLRARVASGKVTALACFANEREPQACEVACTALLGALP